METTIEKFIEHLNEEKVVSARVRTKEETCSGMVEVVLQNRAIFLLTVTTIDCNGISGEVCLKCGKKLEEIQK